MTISISETRAAASAKHKRRVVRKGIYMRWKELLSSTPWHKRSIQQKHQASLPSGVNTTRHATLLLWRRSGQAIPSQTPSALQASLLTQARSGSGTDVRGLRSTHTTPSCTRKWSRRLLSTRQPASPWSRQQQTPEPGKQPHGGLRGVTQTSGVGMIGSSMKSIIVQPSNSTR
jgi:hypothetical protein